MVCVHDPAGRRVGRGQPCRRFRTAPVTASRTVEIGVRDHRGCTATANVSPPPRPGLRSRWRPTCCQGSADGCPCGLLEAAVQTAAAEGATRGQPRVVQACRSGRRGPGVRSHPAAPPRAHRMRPENTAARRNEVGRPLPGSYRSEARAVPSSPDRAQHHGCVGRRAAVGEVAMCARPTSIWLPGRRAGQTSSPRCITRESARHEHAGRGRSQDRPRAALLPRAPRRALRRGRRARR